MSGTVTTQGTVGVCAWAGSTRDDLLATRATLVTVLAHARDPGNVGTLIRSADAFGSAVALSEGCADPLSQKALRASAVFNRLRRGVLQDQRAALIAARNAGELDDEVRHKLDAIVALAERTARHHRLE